MDQKEFLSKFLFKPELSGFIGIEGELRMFGSTDNTDEILEWVSLVKSITKEAL